MASLGTRSASAHIRMATLSCMNGGGPEGCCLGSKLPLSQSFYPLKVDYFPKTLGLALLAISLSCLQLCPELQTHTAPKTKLQNTLPLAKFSSKGLMQDASQASVDHNLSHLELNRSRQINTFNLASDTQWPITFRIRCCQMTLGYKKGDWRRSFWGLFSYTSFNTSDSFKCYK